MAVVERVLPGMRERGFGRVVNVVSTSVREPIAGLMLSNAQRASRSITAFKTLARAVAADGVTLNSVLPGRIATDRAFSLHGRREAAERMARRGGPGGPPRHGRGVRRRGRVLCSTRASYVTGETLAVDGGLMRSVF